MFRNRFRSYSSWRGSNSQMGFPSTDMALLKECGDSKALVSYKHATPPEFA
jgi:hypothetical protein